MKTINEYFVDEIKNCDALCVGEILPYNKLIVDVSTDLLDAFINYNKPILCVCLNNYKQLDEQIDVIKVVDTTTKEFVFFKGTKGELIEGFNSGKYTNTHTALSMLCDDLVILTKIDETKYMFFWYHLSGRCDIGRLSTTDSESVVIQSVFTWIHTLDVNGYMVLNIENFLKGWKHF